MAVIHEAPRLLDGALRVLEPSGCPAVAPPRERAELHEIPCKPSLQVANA